LDTIHYKVRTDGQIVNRAAYVVMGVDVSGKKDILGIWIERILQVLVRSAK
jgi:Transposase and inactivated derivatives